MPLTTQEVPSIAMKIITPKSVYICASTVDWLPVIGSIVAPNEKPISVSKRLPATCRAENIAPSA